MGIGLVSLGIHAVLAWGLALQGWAGRAARRCRLRAVERHHRLAGLSEWCRLSGLGPARCNVPAVRRLGSCRAGRRWRELLRFGLPMGFSNLVEITSFTLDQPVHRLARGDRRRRASHCRQPVGADLHAAAVAGHRHHGRTVGSGGRRGATGLRRMPPSSAGLILSAGLSSLVGLLLWLAAEPLIAAYTDDPAVRTVAGGLIGYIAFYQFFDALQTVAGHACAPIA
jgi:MATE family multidrug resistance protein